jgi:hypothetical protein
VLDPVLGRLFPGGDHCFTGHVGKLLPLVSLCSSKRHTDKLEEMPGFFVRSGRRHHTYLHAAQLVNFVIVDLRKDQLVVQTQRIVPPAVKRVGGDSLGARY